MWFTKIAQTENPGTAELHEFIDGVEQFLNFVVIEKQENFGFLWQNDAKLHELAVATLRNDVSDGVKTMHEAIAGGLSERRVLDHGLKGRPMRFKLRALESIAHRWSTIQDQFKVRPWLKQMFEAIDAVLDSLIDAAGGSGGLIKEFKDVLSALAGTA